MAKNPYLGKSLDEIVALNQANMAARDDLKDEALLLKEAHDQAFHEERARQMLVGFSPDQVNAIAKVARLGMSASVVDLSVDGGAAPDAED